MVAVSSCIHTHWTFRALLYLEIEYASGCPIAWAQEYTICKQIADWIPKRPISSDAPVPSISMWQKSTLPVDPGLHLFHKLNCVLAKNWTSLWQPYFYNPYIFVNNSGQRNNSCNWLLQFHRRSVSIMDPTAKCSKNQNQWSGSAKAGVTYIAWRQSRGK